MHVGASNDTKNIHNNYTAGDVLLMLQVGPPCTAPGSPAGSPCVEEYVSATVHLGLINHIIGVSSSLWPLLHWLVLLYVFSLSMHAIERKGLGEITICDGKNGQLSCFITHYYLAPYLLVLGCMFYS